LDLGDIQLVDSDLSTFQLQKVTKKTSDPLINYTFSAQYAYAEDALTNIELNEQQFKGPVLLEDMNQLLLESAININTENEANPDIEDFLLGQGELSDLDDQALANDLAIRLALSQLSAAEVTIVDPKTDIELSNTLSLEQFRIQNAVVSSPADEREFAIQFDYSTETQVAKNIAQVIQNEESSKEILLESVAVDRLSEEVVEVILKEEEAQKTLDELEAFLKKN